MYRNVALTLLVILTAIIALELARAPRRVPAPSPGDEAAFQANRRVLETRIPDLDLRNTTVGEAIELIRQTTHVPIAANWQSLDDLRKRPVDIELHNVTLGDAMQFLLCLDQYDASYFPIPQAEFDVANGMLMIAAPGRRFAQNSNFPSRSLRLRIYDVRDLLNDSYWGYDSTGGQNAARGESRLDELQYLVQTYAGMKNWQYGIRQGPNASGGGSSSGQEPNGPASVYGLAGRLFVVQTTYGHMRTEAFLERLRAKNTGGR
jgi:hypothetical protein